MDYQDLRVYVPTRGEVYCRTAERLTEAAATYGFQLPKYVIGNVSVADTRNRIVQEFMDDPAEPAILVMCDDDVVPPVEFIDLLCEPIFANMYDVVGGVVMIVRPGTVHLPNVFTWNRLEKDFQVTEDSFRADGLYPVDAVGSGLIAIHRRVLNDIKAPFQFTEDRDGVIIRGEDLTFCKRVSAKNWKIAANYDCYCDHFQALRANQLAEAYLNVINRAAGGQNERSSAAERAGDVGRRASDEDA